MCYAVGLLGWRRNLWELKVVDQSCVQILPDPLRFHLHRPAVVHTWPGIQLVVLRNHHDCQTVKPTTHDQRIPVEQSVRLDARQLPIRPLENTGRVALISQRRPA